MTDPAGPPVGHDQAGYRVRFEWGLAGARALAPAPETGGDPVIAVVVDVLSFTTSVSVAVDRGVAVLPYRWRDPSAAEYAVAHDAVPALGRREAATSGGLSLSPARLLAVEEVPARLVLPSPNGSTIAVALAGTGAQVVAGSLRNRRAVGSWLAERSSTGTPVVVIAAGEQWPDGSLRPAVEDLWGAGAVLAALVDAGGAGGSALSPEARTALAAYRAIADRLPEELPTTASGRELVAAGFGADVEVAADRDVSDVVPLLTGDPAGAAFIDPAAPTATVSP